MKDLGANHFILGMEINRDRVGRRIFLNQSKYIEMILKLFNMKDNQPVRCQFMCKLNYLLNNIPRKKKKRSIFQVCCMLVLWGVLCMSWFVIDLILPMKS